MSLIHPPPQALPERADHLMMSKQERRI
jgi:hypothetical protein